MQITKEDFLKYINRFISYIKREEKLSTAIEEYCDGAYFFTPKDVIDLILDLLIELTGDNKEDSIILYWVYELDFGNSWTEDSITDENGESIKLKTPEDLYDYLVKYGKEKETL